MNLLIIGYCHLQDGFLYASKSLERKKYKIFFFPYLSHIMDKIENIDDILIEYIYKNNIEICLWWCNYLKYDNYEYIISSLMNKYIQNIFFNWDPYLYNYEKYKSFYWQDVIIEKKKIYKLMNCVLSCFEKEIDYFKNKLEIKYSFPGYDFDISKYLYDDNYKCDISIVCTNLYDNEDQFPKESTNITRYNIVNKIYENRDKVKFFIYGPLNFKEKYPDCYQGIVSYNDCNKVFSNSIINLSIHPLIKELNSENSKEEYFSERVPQILGCNGLLVTNSLFTDKLEKNKDYIYIDDKIDWFDYLLSIIKNTDKYNFVRENGNKKAFKYYQWDNWAEIFDSSIIK